VGNVSVRRKASFATFTRAIYFDAELNTWGTILAPFQHIRLSLLMELKNEIWAVFTKSANIGILFRQSIPIKFLDDFYIGIFDLESKSCQIISSNFYLCKVYLMV